MSLVCAFQRFIAVEVDDLVVTVMKRLPWWSPSSSWWYGCKNESRGEKQYAASKGGWDALDSYLFQKNGFLTSTTPHPPVGTIYISFSGYCVCVDVSIGFMRWFFKHKNSIFFVSLSVCLSVCLSFWMPGFICLDSCVCLWVRSLVEFLLMKLPVNA